MRLLPEDLQVSPERKDWNYAGIIAYSEDLHPRRLPGGAATSSRRTTSCAPATSRSSTSRGRRRSSSARPSARSPSSPSRWTTKATWSLAATSPSRSARASGRGSCNHEHLRRHSNQRAGRNQRPLGREGGRGEQFTGWAANYVDERTSLSGFVKELGRKIFPDHWSFVLGEVALYSFVVILLTRHLPDLLLPGLDGRGRVRRIVGSLQGVPMSVAMESTLDISFDIRGGLLIRQIHHWAALLFIRLDRPAHAPGVLHGCASASRAS